MGCGGRPGVEQSSLHKVFRARGSCENVLFFGSLVQSPGWLHISEPAFANNEETCTCLPRLLSIQSSYVNKVCVQLPLSSTWCNLVTSLSFTDLGLCRVLAYPLGTWGLDFL